MARELLDQFARSEEAVKYLGDLRSRGFVGHSQHQQARTLLRRISAHVCKVKITRNEYCTYALRMFVYFRVSCTAEADIANVFSNVATRMHCRSPLRAACSNQEEISNCGAGKRMERFLAQALTSKTQRRPNIFGR